jgi:hypothetical protein
MLYTIFLISIFHYAYTCVEKLNADTIATFYFRRFSDLLGCPPVQTFQDNNYYGPCNVSYTNSSTYWVAISGASTHCGKQIQATFSNTSFRKTVVLTVADECIACANDNHLDMSLEALVELTGSVENACSIHKPLPRISWSFV